MLACNFLNLGETFRSLSFQYRIGERTISGIVDTCQALYAVLKEKLLKVLLTFYYYFTKPQPLYKKYNNNNTYLKPFLKLIYYIFKTYL